jgi:hypothetical protein
VLPEQADRYPSLRMWLVLEMKAALAKGDKTLSGVVLNELLAWPDCAFRDEAVKHPRHHATDQKPVAGRRPFDFAQDRLKSGGAVRQRGNIKMGRLDSGAGGPGH